MRNVIINCVQIELNLCIGVESCKEYVISEYSSVLGQGTYKTHHVNVPFAFIFRKIIIY
jgi:hypothetical protein